MGTQQEIDMLYAMLEEKNITVNKEINETITIIRQIIQAQFSVKFMDFEVKKAIKKYYKQCPWVFERGFSFKDCNIEEIYDIMLKTAIKHDPKRF